MTNTQPHLHELYSSSKGSSWQCDLTDKLYISFKGTVFAFRVQDFLGFRKKIASVDIHEMIFNLADQYDFEIVEAPQNGISLKLTLCDIIQLRELLDGTKFALTMYSMLHEVLGAFEIV